MSVCVKVTSVTGFRCHLPRVNEDNTAQRQSVSGHTDPRPSASHSLQRGDASNESNERWSIKCNSNHCCQETAWPILLLLSCLCRAFSPFSPLFPVSFLSCDFFFFTVSSSSASLFSHSEPPAGLVNRPVRWLLSGCEEREKRREEQSRDAS